jgi:putative phosphoesterase
MNGPRGGERQVRLGIISDVHGDPLALMWTLAHFQRLGVSRAVSCGDLVGYGPMPDRVVELCAIHHVDSARGNHDRWAVERGAGVPDEYGGGTPGAGTVERLGSLPQKLFVGGHDRMGLVVHATPESDMEIVDQQTHGPKDLEGLLERHGVDFLITGHTHKPWWFRCERGLVLNPGSLTTVLNVATSRSFAVLDLATLEPAFYDVETGDRRAVSSWHGQMARPQY